MENNTEERKQQTGKKPRGRSVRRRSRELALQGIYQFLVSGASAHEIKEGAMQCEEFNNVDPAFYENLLEGVLNEFTSLEEDYRPFIDRDVTQLSPIERAILLIGTYELKNTVTPYRVVINEAVELDKTFGGADGFKYVNGVLDKLSGKLRSHEIKTK